MLRSAALTGAGLFAVGAAARRFSRRIGGGGGVLMALLARFHVLFVRTALCSARIGHVSLLLMGLLPGLFESPLVRLIYSIYLCGFLIVFLIGIHESAN
jgi:hypothetical protein